MRVPRIVISVLFTAAAPLLEAGPLDQSLAVETGTLRDSARSQRKIDKLDDATRKMLEEYRRTLREIETLKAYTANLKQLVDSQRQEKASLQRQIEEIAIAEREIVPLMTSMVQTLEEFIELDIPFLPEERHQRIDQLKRLLGSPETTTAEKFRRILEAYQIENEYALTIEAYREELTLNGEKKPVDFLRIGRVALFYQTLDGNHSGFWVAREKRWQALPDDYRRPIRQGLRIARKEAAPDLLTLPMPTAGASQ